MRAVTADDASPDPSEVDGRRGGRQTWVVPDPGYDEPSPPALSPLPPVVTVVLPPVA